MLDLMRKLFEYLDNATREAEQAQYRVNTCENCQQARLNESAGVCSENGKSISLHDLRDSMGCRDWQPDF